MIRGNGHLDAVKTPMTHESGECSEPFSSKRHSYDRVRELSMVDNHRYMNWFDRN